MFAALATSKATSPGLVWCDTCSDIPHQGNAQQGEPCTAGTTSYVLKNLLPQTHCFSGCCSTCKGATEVCAQESDSGGMCSITAQVGDTILAVSGDQNFGIIFCTAGNYLQQVTNQCTGANGSPSFLMGGLYSINGHNRVEVYLHGDLLSGSSTDRKTPKLNRLHLCDSEIPVPSESDKLLALGHFSVQDGGRQ